MMMGEEAAFGDAGRTVVIEERLRGREVTAHAFTDGLTTLPLPYSCDYKRALDGDDGPNTGGRGPYTPPGGLDAETARHIDTEITAAAVDAMMAEGAPY